MLHPSSSIEQLRSLPADHIDLLLTAAIDLGVIAVPSGVPRPRMMLLAIAQRVGTHLYMRNREGEAGGYRFRPVEDPLDMREILKASHAAQYAYQHTKLWSGSDEKLVVDAVAKAAAMRTPGYDLAPWVWRRPARTCAGFAPQGAWAPAVDGLDWFDDVDAFSEVWADSRIIITTLDGLKALPELPARAHVYVLVEPDDAGAGIQSSALARYIEGILVWPDAQAWLEEQLLP